MLLLLNLKYSYKFCAGYFILLFLFTIQSFGQTAASSLPDSIQQIPDTLLIRIEQAQSAINQINTAIEGSFQIGTIKKDLPEIQQNIDEIRQDILHSGKIPDARTLLSYQVLLKDHQALLGNWKKTLTTYNATLQKYSSQLVVFGSDSLLSNTTSDTTQKRLYGPELSNLRLRLQESGVKTTANLDSIGTLLASVSGLFFSTNELQSVIIDRLRQSGKTSFGRESPYIWSASKQAGKESLRTMLSDAWSGQNRALRYFLSSSWDNRTLLLLLGLIFFIWVYRNYKKALQPPISEQLTDLRLDFINPVPLLSSVIFLLNLAPLFDPDSPSLYFEIIEFLLLITLTIFFRKHWKKEQYYIWLVIVLIYITTVLTNAVMNQGLLLRLWLIALNIVSIYFGLHFYREIRNVLLLKSFIKPVSILYIGLHILSIVFNVFGRISISTTFSLTAIVGLTQIIALSAFVQILTEATDLQIKITSCSNSLFSRINLQRVRSTVKEGLTVIAVLIWSIVFVINLNISGILYEFISGLLTQTRTFGSVKFTIGNILLFGLILYLANLFQKYTGILFGDENATFGNQTQRKSSKLLLIRLVIFIVGFLLAITASGFSLDKLTVIIGALGVGIGLGMQNIVNNFVSGIILIFEKPFQIGDFIELADKKGRVKDIGIRSSKLLTPQGSIIIVPNGDLLSGRLVNWTLSNSFVKTEITFKIASESDLELVQTIIKEEAQKAEFILPNSTPETFFKSFAGDTVELKLELWINSIYNESSFKSNLLHAIYKRLKENEIKML
ncbi:Potassium efflux system KefA protein [Arcticibacter svalbardensis MN12-7]|uniref:Potassium efflux system KefA protein n=1 Tax=Arcticibacter svalbardensis MN12-7 TaxID=1150600 RepID=R9GVE3_9SPHI|nr:mechanosensitive ion channel domain-containing protein [Arcticibacter svalbardensis]EOR95633.1 Potassium efflux system KefA protein [Arcticibacter svalbardensis MN12-7]